ncbi:tRNA (adenosine(37)-N6)-threonylcarbamoyltransferase complex dimerization subunit type 1 TsaB [Gimesia fumaroli]|uniref:tRNA threonylcarbamoyladenosine biosynthesis protein TsaB n=1 Tax=Gimesia fumaroli TaxID=2527976 RepID=A0A518IBW5_9PLAN|nr:tRNA (adenosine(37)-N6)-threonylcarbamoyltransferase complex dimerization subunit type 1 TsaB [Gimesia fumaroli]QDV50593.1 tRNA threonylcarbamoyladenosine biosynthesis protein TsaB [Gimesia fumaroli]
MENSQFYLGVETSGHSGSVAIHGPQHQIVQVDLQQQGRKHAQTLVAEVKKLLDQLDLSPSQITGIGVSRGPGSFTGLRIGTTFAKTFGYVTGCPVLGIDSFEAIALNCPPEIQETYVISNAQRGDLFVGKYTRISDSQWQQISEIGLCEIDDFCRLLNPGETISGPGVTLLDASSFSDVRLLEPEYRLPEAAKISLITARILQNCLPKQHEILSETWNLTPFYLRKSAAEEKWDAQQKDQTD